MKDQSNKMVYGNAADLTKKRSAKKEEAMEVIDDKIKEEEEIKIKERSLVTPDPIEENSPQINVIEDLDLESFFFTGEIQHKFNFGKFSITLRLLKGDETTQLHEMLWKLVEKNVSAPEAAMRQMIETVSMALIKYGPNDFSDKDLEEKKEFVGKLPGVVIKKLMDCFTQLEYSANKLLEEDNALLKN